MYSGTVKVWFAFVSGSAGVFSCDSDAQALPQPADEVSRSAPEMALTETKREASELKTKYIGRRGK